MDTERKKAVAALVRYFAKVAAGAFIAGILVSFAIAKGLTENGTSLLSATKPTLIFYPVFVMFLLVAAVLTRMGFLRIGGVLRGNVDVEFYSTFDKGEEPKALRVVTRHFINLFEMPVLFYVAVVIAFVTQQVTCWLVGLAWAFVALRLLHSFVHLSSNDVAARLSAYVASGLVLLVFWVSLFVGLVRAT